MTSPPLRVEELREALRDCRIARAIHVLAATGSTNDAILEIATPDVESGLVLFAETQTAGRGQRGNRWESAARKGLWLSLLLEPRIALIDSPRLTEWAAGSVRDVIASNFALDARIKPPNDVMLSQKKVAGVLVEMRAQTGGLHRAIVGIGVNVNQTEADFSESIRDRATSLSLEYGRLIDRTALSIMLLNHLDQTCKLPL